jgi:hypothetical protein
MQGILNAFADRNVQIPPEEWRRHAMPVQVTTSQGNSVSVEVLKPETVECIRKALGNDTTVESINNGLLLRFVSETIPVSVFLPAWWSIILGGGAGNLADVNNGPIAVSKIPGDKHLKVVEAIAHMCGRPSEKDIQKAVATREGKKAYRAMLGWQGPDGRELPVEVARNIAKLAAVKKVDGGKKKTRKSRNTKKSTRRR